VGAYQEGGLTRGAPGGRSLRRGGGGGGGAGGGGRWRDRVLGEGPIPGRGREPSTKDLGRETSGEKKTRPRQEVGRKRGIRQVVGGVKIGGGGVVEKWGGGGR